MPPIKRNAPRARSATSITKPNGRSQWRVTYTESVKFPRDKGKNITHMEDGSVVETPVEPSVLLIMEAKEVLLPCTVEVYADIISKSWYRDTSKRFFLYQRQVKAKAAKETAVGPVEFVSVLNNEDYARKHDADAAHGVRHGTLFVDTKDGGAIITNTHYKHPGLKAERIASAVAAATSLKEGDNVAGSKDLYISRIEKLDADTEYEVEVRSYEGDKEESEIKASGYLN